MPSLLSWLSMCHILLVCGCQPLLSWKWVSAPSSSDSLSDSTYQTLIWTFQYPVTSAIKGATHPFSWAGEDSRQACWTQRCIMSHTAGLFKNAEPHTEAGECVQTFDWYCTCRTACIPEQDKEIYYRKPDGVNATFGLDSSGSNSLNLILYATKC